MAVCGRTSAAAQLTAFLLKGVSPVLPSFLHPLPLSFHSHIVSLTSHVLLAIIMKLKLFSTADVCPGNNHTEIGFIHLTF